MLTASRTTLRNIPIWYHREADKKIRTLNNSKASKCLRTKHKIVTTGEAEDLATILTSTKDHLDTDECECTECNTIETLYGCEHPNSCMKRARELLDTLPPKWDPRNDQPNDYEYEQEDENLDQEWIHLEQRLTSATEPKDLFRIFTDKEVKSTNLLDFERRSLLYDPTNPETAAICGYAENAGTDNARAGLGVYIGSEPNEENRISTRIPRHLPQTKTNAEIMALATALKKTDVHKALDIESTSDTMAEMLTKYAQVHEDEGFANLEDPEPLKNAISHLRKRKAPTRLKIVPADKKTPRNRTAEKLAREAVKTEPMEEYMDTDHTMFATGAKLAKMTQALAYKMIKKEKHAKIKQRRRTEEMIEKIKAQIEELFGFTPDNKSIWRATRHKDFSKKTQQFLWRITHEAYMLADKWLRDNFSEELKERAYCTNCSGKLETMEHILTECESPGQTLIWKLAGKLWKKKNGPEWFKPGLGGIAGAALAGNANAKIREMKKGESRLWRILITESAYLIWLMRCEKEMRDAYKPPTEEEIAKRWEKTINDRLQLDRRMTHRKFETKAISAAMVKCTWKGTLKGENTLPEDWVTKPGVLVGIDIDNSCCLEEEEEEESRDEERDDDGRDEGGGNENGNARGTNVRQEVHTCYFYHQSPTLRA